MEYKMREDGTDGVPPSRFFKGEIKLLQPFDCI